MFPILYQYGVFVVTSFGVFLTLGFLAFLIALQWYGPTRNLSISFFVKHLFSLFIATIVGSKLLFWLAELPLLSGTLTVQLVREDYYGIFRTIFNSEEFFIAGGILAFLGLFTIYARKHKESLYSWLDVLVPSFLVGMLFGYIGAFLGGFYVGEETSSFLGILFTGEPRYSFASQLYTVAIHPIQLYSFFATFIILVIVRILLRRISVHGAVGVIGIALFSLQVIIVEIFRGGDNMFRFLGITLNQYIAAVFLLGACYIFLKKLPKVDFSGNLPMSPEEIHTHPEAPETTHQQ